MNAIATYFATHQSLSKYLPSLYNSVICHSFISVIHRCTNIYSQCPTISHASCIHRIASCYLIGSSVCTTHGLATSVLITDNCSQRLGCESCSISLATL